MSKMPMLTDGEFNVWSRQGMDGYQQDPITTVGMIAKCNPNLGQFVQTSRSKEAPTLIYAGVSANTRATNGMNLAVGTTRANGCRHESARSCSPDFDKGSPAEDERVDCALFFPLLGGGERR